MPIERIVFLVEQPFDSRNHDRFGIEILQRAGFEVVVYDFTPFRFRSAIRQSQARLFRDQKEALTAISKLDSGTFVINFLGFCPETYPIYRALSKRNIPYAVNTVNALPLPVSAGGLGQKLSRLRLLGQSTRNLFYRQKARSLKGASVWLAGGSESPSQYFYPRDKKTRILWTHTLDYDLYLRERNGQIDESDNAVFLDQYLPFHSDFKAEGRRPPVESRSYYRSIAEFLDEVERGTGLRAEVAAHPRSDGDASIQSYFPGRCVIHGRTVDLIQRSKLVVAHYTTAVNLAVLFRKPIVFITTGDLQRSHCGPQIDAMAAALNRRVINLDDRAKTVDWKIELEVDEDAYRAYQRRFISTEMAAPEKPAWQIVADALKNWNEGMTA